MNIDETGFKENGKRRWIGCFCTPHFTVYHIDSLRSTNVLFDRLGGDYSGIIGCDFYGAYQNLAG